MASDSFNITGEIQEIFDTEEIGENRLRKREFVIKTGGKYPQVLKFQCVKDKCDLLDQFQRGDLADVGFDLRGREHNGKYYNSLECWKLTRTKDETRAERPREEYRHKTDRFSRPPEQP